MSISRLFLVLLLLCVPGWTACVEEEDSSTVDPTVAPDVSQEALTWHRDVKPIIEAQCVVCHSEGSIGPFELDTYDAFTVVADMALASMESGSMPPWMPADDCRDLRDARVLDSAAVETVRDWMESGMVRGDPTETATTQEQPQDVGFEPTHMGLIAEAYTPNPSLPDDYRCFILDTEFEEDMYLTASQIVPDAKSLVHHVLVYAIPPDHLDIVMEADTAEEGSGYTCFGSVVPSSSGQSSSSQNRLGLFTSVAEQVDVWVPGMLPNIMDEGQSVPILKGSKLIMQIHYSLLDNTPVTDMTAFQMTLQTEPTEQVIHTEPIVIYDLEIPADEPNAENVRVFRNYSDRTIRVASMFPHMHLLGSSFQAEVIRTSDSEECLIDLPKWDFSWQQTYRLPKGQGLELEPGDAIRLHCNYDNSAANQPLVNGEQIEPRDVTWGEGSLEEMCMLYLSFVEPYVPPVDEDADASLCAGADACLAACPADASKTDCLLGCGLPTSCFQCVIPEILACSPCVGSFLDQQECFTHCLINVSVLGGDASACLKDTCGEGYAEVISCTDPSLESGDCDSAMAKCNITL